MLVANSTRLVVRSRQRGVTLIEALAAFVILSIGLLGIVSLQALSKTAQHQAIQRTIAVALADDMLERIRINPAGVTTYDSDLTPLGGNTITNEPSPNCTAATCTPTELAVHDRWAWEERLDGAGITVVDGGVNKAVGGLINPRGCIDFTADAGKTLTGVVRVIVQWTGLEETSDAVPAGGSICGGAAAGSDDKRRQVVVSSYVLDGNEI